MLQYSILSNEVAKVSRTEDYKIADLGRIVVHDLKMFKQSHTIHIISF